MTAKQITEKQALELSKFETARQIRELLDTMLKKFPEDDRADIETEVLELVTEEE